MDGWMMAILATNENSEKKKEKPLLADWLTNGSYGSRKPLPCGLSTGKWGEVLK
jgi:hypothetical protein